MEDCHASNVESDLVDYSASEDCGTVYSQDQNGNIPITYSVWREYSGKWIMALTNRDCSPMSARLDYAKLTTLSLLNVYYLFSSIDRSSSALRSVGPDVY